MLDNCGEIVFDTILIEVLLKIYPHLNITAVVRKDEIINDYLLNSDCQSKATKYGFNANDDYKDGFIDPYYNKLKKDSKELKEYKEAISKSAGVNACAFIRIVLVYLRKQIIDTGNYFGSPNIIQQFLDEKIIY